MINLTVGNPTHASGYLMHINIVAWNTHTVNGKIQNCCNRARSYHYQSKISYKFMMCFNSLSTFM